MLAAAVRPQPVYPAPLPPPRAAQAPGEDQQPLVVARKGDRLDRVGMAERASLGGSSGAAGAGGTVIAKDASRLGAGEASAQPMRSAYAALPPRPPASIPLAAQNPPPRPLAQSSVPPGWSIGAQPVARGSAGRGVPEPSAADGDPDE
jgi:hypothetical protein